MSEALSSLSEQIAGLETTHDGEQALRELSPLLLQLIHGIANGETIILHSNTPGVFHTEYQPATALTFEEDMISRFKTTLEGRRIAEFFGKRAEKYGLTETDFNIIAQLYTEGKLRTYDQVVMNAQQRSRQKKIPFMQAVFSIVAETNLKQLPPTPETTLPEQYGYEPGIAESPQPSPDPQATPQIDLTGLDKLTRRLGWRSRGDVARPKIDKGSLHREQNFRDAQKEE